MQTRLADPALYAAAFHAIAAKERDRTSDEPALAGGPSMASLGFEVNALSRRLAALVSTYRYELSPVVPRRALIEGKARILFHSPPLDMVVLSALSVALGQVLSSTYSDRVFSYRAGRSTKQALVELSEFMRAHRAARPDPRTRGLYVLRRDVKAYGDRIPSGPDSPLWRMLRHALSAQNVTMTDASFAWLVRAIRPPIATDTTLDLDPTIGIPTGSPLQPLMGNLYLSDLDKVCERVDGAFYARYGDDIIFAHPQAETAEAAAQTLALGIAELGLEWSADKCSNLFLTAAGRAASRPEYRAATSLSYLGARVDARGEIGLSPEKVTRLLRSISRRLDAANRLCHDDDLESRADTYCGIINASLDPEHPVADRAAQLLRTVVTDRSQLKDLDYQLALRAAERLTGMRGVRAFRSAPMHVLKQRHGLRSLVVERNRVEHGRRAK